MSGKFVRFFVVPATLLGAGTAPLRAEAQHEIGIQGTVPLSCRVALAGELTSGSTAVLREFCNNSSGYQVVADHSPDLAGATLLVDGYALTLSEHPTIVSRSTTARIASRQIALQRPAGARVGSISFRIIPL
jgi:hypothetical protein